jgi:P27 family predicted phage terminase small subunit
MAGTKNSGGRNRKSSAMHLLEGTHRPDRHGERETPEPPTGRPDTPPMLAGHALAEWDRMIARLEALGTLAVVDDAALYQYVCLFGETEDTQDRRRETAGLVTTLQATIAREATRIGNVAPPVTEADDDPLDTARRELADAVSQVLELQQLIGKMTTQLRQGHMAIRQYLVEFGLTPAARTRVSGGRREGDRAPGNPLDRFTKVRA